MKPDFSILVTKVSNEQKESNKKPVRAGVESEMAVWAQTYFHTYTGRLMQNKYRSMRSICMYVRTHTCDL